MNKITLKDGKTVGYYSESQIQPLALVEDYIVYALQSSERLLDHELVKQGFFFADRRFNVEISIKEWNHAVKSGDRQKFVILNDWDAEEIFHIAKESFEEDCRFAVDLKEKNSNIKNELLWNYILMLQRSKYMATCCYIDDQLVGFNIWTLEGTRGRILLGAVSQNVKGTGIAMYLYAYTIQYMQEYGGTTLTDAIFSSNLLSLNLHIMLANYGGGGKKEIKN